MLTVAVGAIAGLTASAAERKDTRPVLDPPPPGLPQNVVVPRGKTVEIPLKIYGKRGEPLRFQIKTMPRHGKLSELRAVARESWAVTYEPPSDPAIKSDRFTFSAQSSAGVSAPAEVVVTITDEAPLLAVPHTLEFGEVLAGATLVKEFEIANRGGGVITGEITATPPFRIEGRNTYRLERNDFAYFKVVFAPTTGGEFRGEIAYSSHREFITSVLGAAQMPVSAEPARVELRSNATTPVRAGGFELVNRTNQELTFSLQGSPRLKLPASVVVPASGRATVALTTADDDVTDLSEEVRVTAEGFSLRVPVQGAKVGPMLRSNVAKLSLGRADAALGLQGSVEVSNVGGTTARVTAEVNPPFVLDASAFDLVPGASRRLGVNLHPSEPRRLRSWLRFKGGTAPLEVEIDGELLGPGGVSVAAADATRPKTPVAPGATPEPWMPDLNLAKAIRVTNITSGSADLEWPADMNGATKYACQRLMLTRDSAKRLRHAWVDVPKVSFARRGSQLVASVSGLQPQQSQTVRIVPIDLEGKMGPEMFRLDFYTQPKASLPRPRLIPSLALLLLVGLGALVWKRFRSQFTAPLGGL